MVALFYWKTINFVIVLRLLYFESVMVLYLAFLVNFQFVYTSNGDLPKIFDSQQNDLHCGHAIAYFTKS
jgi:hypothetical protein